MKRLANLILLFSTPSFIYGAGNGVKVSTDLFFELGGFPITNSMVTSWVLSLFIVILVKILVGTPQLVPTRGQLVLESVIGGIRGIIQPIVGPKVFFPSFWLLSGLFFFILIHNWSGLLPGVGTIGYGQFVDDHFSVSKPLIRPENADLNMTLALALVANISWIYFIVKYAGIKAIIKDWFGNKAQKSEVSSVIFGLLGIIFLAVGVIECFPYCFVQFR